MSESLEYNKESYTEGEAAFARGMSVAQCVDHMNTVTACPDAPPREKLTSTEWQKRAQEQDAREANGTGFLLGYINGIVQAIRNQS